MSDSREVALAGSREEGGSARSDSLDPRAVEPSASADRRVAEARGLSKSFGRSRALDRASFDLRAGEVHVLAGANGAGKSTLVKILSGALAPDEGEILLDGRPVRLRSPADAARQGIATIHQELSLVGSMSVAENLFLGRRGGLFGLAGRRKAIPEAAAILEGIGLAVDPARLVEDLPVSSQQLVEIARALAAGAKLLLLDEPTSALGDHESEALLAKIRGLRAQGRSILYISHRMEEIYALADRITVLRDGAVVVTAVASDLPREELIERMVGRALAAVPAPLAVREGRDVLLKVDGLRVLHADSAGHSGLPGPLRHDVEDLSFSARRGEIVGLAGLAGSGVSQVLHGIFGGLGRRAKGAIQLSGAPFFIDSPSQSIRNGIALLTNDRKSAGLVMDLGAVENATLACLRRFVTLGWLRRAEERDAAASILEQLKLKAASIDAPVRGLSGGNQQKVYLARCLLAAPKLLLLDEPTRGVDVAAKADIHDLLRRLAESGVSILLATSEMDELILLCDRILVLHRGRMTAELERAAATRSAILRAAMGGQGDLAS